MRIHIFKNFAIANSQTALLLQQAGCVLSAPCLAGHKLASLFHYQTRGNRTWLQSIALVWVIVIDWIDQKWNAIVIELTKNEM